MALLPPKTIKTPTNNSTNIIGVNHQAFLCFKKFQMSLRNSICEMSELNN